MEPIPAPQGSVSSTMLPGRGNRKSIHYYSQSSPVMDRHVYTTAQPGVPMNGAQVAQAPQNSGLTVPPSAMPPLPMATPEPEVRVREEIPTAPNAIRRMSYTEFGARAKTSSPTTGSSGSTIRFADEP
jgi:hypothetical protein